MYFCITLPKYHRQVELAESRNCVNKPLPRKCDILGVVLVHGNLCKEQPGRSFGIEPCHDLMVFVGVAAVHAVVYDAPAVSLAVEVAYAELQAGPEMPKLLPFVREIVLA